MNQQGKSTCFQCGSKDHWESECPTLTQAQHKEVKEHYAQMKKRGINIVNI